MKKILLSLSALFAVSIASAQSYAKQPDPATYEVIEYKPAPKAQTPPPAATQPEQATETRKAPKRMDAFDAGNNEATANKPQQQPANVPDNDAKVVQNRRR